MRSVCHGPCGLNAPFSLLQVLPGIVSGINFRKSMRWDSKASFSRPLRWLLALHGDAVVPFVWGGVSSGRITRLLRNSDAPETSVPSAGKLADALAAAGIDFRVASRRERIWKEAQAVAGEAGGSIPDKHRAGLLEEVANLVEAPSIGEPQEKCTS